MRTLLIITLFLTPLFIDPSTANASNRDWTLSTVDGKRYKLSEETEGPALLIFWATWCVPCKKELDEYREELTALSEQIPVILISEDTQKTQSRVAPYVKSKKIEWPVLLDPDGRILKIYGGTSLPYTVLIDGDGAPYHKFKGAIKKFSDLQQKVNALVETDS